MTDEQTKTKNQLTARQQISLFPDWFQPVEDPHGLNVKHRLFVLFYVGEAKGNATAAARMAGFKGKNIRVTASKLLSKPNIKKAISDRRLELVENIKTSHLKTLKLMEAHAFSDIRKLYGEDGRLKNIADIDDETAAAIESVEVREGEEKVLMGGTIIAVPMSTVKVKLTSKASARSDLLKVQGLLRDVLDVNPQGNFGVIYFPEKAPEGKPIDEAALPESKS